LTAGRARQNAVRISTSWPDLLGWTVAERVCESASVGLNSTSAVILGVLHDGTATGGEIVAAASRRLTAQGGVTRSQVYRELPALAQAGYLKAGKEGARSSHPYSITPAGRKAFAQWASTSNGNDSVRSQAVLRLGFGAHLSTKQRQEIIEAARQEHESALAAHKRDAAELKKVGDTYGAIAVEFAIAYERALIRWLDTVPTS
jgi:DNA-binding PadR family transcriptional regulator